jgi:serine/threonine protein kinase
MLSLFFRGGELFIHIKKARRFDDIRVSFYAAQIAIALGFLHKNKIIYRDLKLTNILMDVDGFSFF